MTTTKEAADRFTVTWREGRYFVSIPEYQGGEVVRVEVHDALRARVAELDLFEALEANCWDLRCIDIPTGGGDADVGWNVIEHHMAAPKERIVGTGNSPIAAIRAALGRAEQ